MQELLQTLAVVVPIVAGLYIVHYFRYRTVVAQAFASGREPAPTVRKELQSEVAALKTRVEVLESIVTDKRYELEQRIREL